MKLLLPLLLLLALFAAACSGDDNETDDEAGGPTATAQPTAANDTAKAILGIDFPEDLADGMAIGKADAPVTLTAFEDFQCPFCLRFTTNFEALIIEEYVAVGKVRFEFRHLPILGQESVLAAAGGVCAAEQDRFWPYHKLLFLIQANAGQLQDEELNVGRFSASELSKAAGVLGMDTAAFTTCLSATTTADTITAHIREASDKGFRGTPAFLLNGQPLSGSPANEASWRKVLDDAVAAAD